MARSRHVALLALVMLAMIGLAAAADAPKPSEEEYEEDDEEFLLGTRMGDPPSASANGVVAGPIGGPVPPGAFEDTPTPPSAASTIHFSAVAAATAAVAGFFYF